MDVGTRLEIYSSISTAKVRKLGAQEPSWVLLGSIWGSLGTPFRAQLGSFFQVWFQGGFQGALWVHFWSSFARFASVWWSSGGLAWLGVGALERLGVVSRHLLVFRGVVVVLSRALNDIVKPPDVGTRPAIPLARASSCPLSIYCCRIC